jgi:hypothetical protein
MEFFNKKEEVLEVKLTPYGRYKLSKGRLRPVYYAFFDEGIIYNSAFVTGSASESQNSIEPRIQDGTPSIKALNVYAGIQTAQSASAALIRQAFAADPTLLDDPLFMDPGAIYNLEYSVLDKIDFLNKPLGKSRLASDKQPAWGVVTRQGQVSSSAVFYSSSAGIEKIPQVDIKIRYRTYAAAIPDWSPEMANSPEFSDEALTEEVNTHNVQAITSPVRASDGKYVVISPEDLILEVTEYNVDFNKENFDIEVYISGNNFPGGLQPLRFNNDLEATYQNVNVEYYLNLNADNDISNELLKQANIRDFTALGTEPGSRVVSTREYFIRELYEPEEEVCE